MLKKVNKGSGMLKLAEILGINESEHIQSATVIMMLILKVAAFSFFPANGGEEAVRG